MVTRPPTGPNSLTTTTATIAGHIQSHELDFFGRTWLRAEETSVIDIAANCVGGVEAKLLFPQLGQISIVGINFAAQLVQNLSAINLAPLAVRVFP